MRGIADYNQMAEPGAWLLQAVRGWRLIFRPAVDTASIDDDVSLLFSHSYPYLPLNTGSSIYLL